MNNKKIKFSLYFILVIILTLGFSMSLQPLLAGWVEPGGNPTTCNPGDIGCDRLVDMGTQVQTKGGPLYVNNDAVASLGFVVVNGRASINPITPNNNSQLQINASVSTEGLRIVSASDYSPLNIRNSVDNEDIFRVDQSGILAVGAIPWAQLSNFPTQCPAGEYVSGVGENLICTSFKSCPSGFTAVINSSRVLGCIQTNPNTSKNCRNAMLDCFDNYGGRLPEYEEIYIAFNKISGLGAITSNEWSGPAYFDVDQRCNVIQPDLDLNKEQYNENLSYRCWIPAGSLGY